MPFDSSTKITLWSIGGAVVLLGSLQLATLDIAIKSLRSASEAKLSAQAARPNPWTSIDERAATADHAIQHANETTQLHSFFRTFTALESERINRRIDNLPPDKFLEEYNREHDEIVALFYDLRERLGYLEILFERAREISEESK